MSRPVALPQAESSSTREPDGRGYRIQPMAPSERHLVTRLALHACCGPCLLEPYDELAREADEIVVVYSNPNIHGLDEYEARRDSLLEYARENDIEVVELEYDPATWVVEVGRYGEDLEQRCRACYELRLRRTAQWAAEHGYDAIATTLTVSPYQDADAISEEGMRAAEDAGIDYLDRDFRDRFRVSAERSRELGMYRQRYCGCVLSEVAAEIQRRERKAARANR